MMDLLENMYIPICMKKICINVISASMLYSHFKFIATSMGNTSLSLNLHPQTDDFI